MNIFKNFKTYKKLIENSKFVKVYSCKCDDKEYIIAVTKKRANRFSIIHCVDDSIVWEQAPRFYRLGGGYTTPIYKPATEKNKTAIFVIKGKPNGIIGLDDSIFRSANKFDANYINVMTYKKFKTL